MQLQPQLGPGHGRKRWRQCGSPLGQEVGSDPQQECGPFRTQTAPRPHRCSRAQGLRQAPRGLPEVPPLPPGSPQIFLEGRPMCALAGGGLEAPRPAWASRKPLHAGPRSEGPRAHGAAAPQGRPAAGGGSGLWVTGRLSTGTAGGSAPGRGGSVRGVGGQQTPSSGNGRASGLAGGWWCGEGGALGLRRKPPDH